MLNGKTVFLTGGNGFLGKTFTASILSSGAKVIVCDLDEKAFEKNNYPTGKVLFVKTDITSKSSIEDAITKAHQKFGQIDCLINNAYPRNKNYGKSFEDVTYEDFCENTNSHLGGYFLTSQCFIKFFKTQGFGNIISISSIYGVVPPKFEIYEGTSMTMPVEYAVIKSGLIHLTKYISKYTKGHNIRANCISPGGLLNAQPENFVSSYNKLCLNKGMLEPRDIAGTLSFLVSDHSQYINGQNIVVDDGFTL